MPPEKIRVVPLAPSDVFRPVRDDDRLAAIRERYLGADEPFFLFVGKLTPRRHVPNLIEAFARFRRGTNQPARLLVVGLNTTGFDVAALAQRLGIGSDVVHVPFVPDEDLNLLYNAATAFVLPFTYEAVSLTLIEAQATGCPVVTVDAAGLREVTGGHALFLKSAEIEEIERGLSTIWRDEQLRGRLSEAGRAHARQFTWQRTAAGTLDVLAEAAAGR